MYTFLRTTLEQKYMSNMSPARGPKQLALNRSTMESKRHDGVQVLEEESWRSSHEEGTWRKNQKGEIMEEESRNRRDEAGRASYVHEQDQENSAQTATVATTKPRHNRTALITSAIAASVSLRVAVRGG